jgi:hypothetical protein
MTGRKARAAAAEAPGTAAVIVRPDRLMRNWRYIVGTFAVRIPVTRPRVMLPIEENTYAILKWRLSQLAHANRWVPVLERYLGLIEGRIRGLGGDPGAIEPSPWGSYGPPPPTRGGEGGFPFGRGATGKVEGVVYDRFGDFEGFLLLTEEGQERAYLSREAEIESLARQAWVERMVITVFSEAHAPDRPISIILRRAPPQPKRPWP